MAKTMNICYYNLFMIVRVNPLELMRCIHFPEANAEFTKPESMTDEECYSVSAYKGYTEDGQAFIRTCWLPNKEDIEAILAGRPVVLHISGAGMPPVALFTYDENGNSND